MNRVGVVGIDWRTRGPEGLADYTIPADQRAVRVPGLQREVGARELVYLATCNRVEVIFVVQQGVSVAAYRPRIFRALRGREPASREAECELRAWRGEGAAEHLFLMAAGLQSAMLGEREIVGQMREALQLAQEVGTSGAILEWLFSEAWKVGRKVHRVTSLGEGKVSVAELALDHVRERLEQKPGPVALVGVSPMTLHCARTLVEEGVSVFLFNRTLERARQTAATLGVQGRGLEELRQGLDFDLAAVVLATAAPGPVLRRADLERLAATRDGWPPLIVDLATPPDVDPDDARAVGLERVGMEEFLEIAEDHRQSRTAESRAARQIVDRALVDLDTKLVGQVLAPMLASLQRRYRAIAERGVDRLLRKDLKDVDDHTEETIRRWAQILARRFAHIPTTGLRAVTKDYGFEVLESFFAEADEALALELRRIREDESRALPSGVRIDTLPSSEEVIR